MAVVGPDEKKWRTKSNGKGRVKVHGRWELGAWWVRDISIRKFYPILLGMFLNELHVRFVQLYLVMSISGSIVLGCWAKLRFPHKKEMKDKVSSPLILSSPLFSSSPLLSSHLLSYLILSFLILSYLILSHLISISSPLRTATRDRNAGWCMPGVPRILLGWEKQHLRGVQVPSHPPPKGGGWRRGGTRAPHAGGKFALI